MSVIGIIGGSGLYDLPGLAPGEERIASAFGEPSDAVRRGRIGGNDVVFLPRHGRGHRLAPHEINYRANIDALKRAGATHVLSVTAVGSYRAELYPGLFVFPDQYVDRTSGRARSFFGEGVVAHVPFAHPVSPLLVDHLVDAARAEDIAVSKGGTLVCIDGPAFSSRAESLLFKSFNFDLVGMTALPEAKLAREAELPYATIAMVTDFDCWHPEHDAVTVAGVVAVAQENAARVVRLLTRFVEIFPADAPPCPVRSERALDGAVMTAPGARDPAAVARLEAVAGRVLRAG